ncbi:NAD(P)-dependent oxidoreductase [Arsenicicoccus cauae]|uniref:NAD(P)-dependent oxidoreductase n=1 Tax=Arsenicicoccus cauae TaxID=2663847 RepID=UPI00289E4EA3|nr:NAD(P)-dependent oxidoreductase [Arsenicicoccus cauae]
MSKVVIVDDEFLDACGDQLKVVANVAVGYDNIDVHACERRGVVATNTPKVLTETTADVAGERGARKVELDELLSCSDVVSLHCPLTDSTHHLIDADALERMKTSAYLVNSARGPIVDEAALVAALEAGEIAGAGLDVFEAEPTVHEGLLDRDDVVLLPHLGSATVEPRTAMAELAAQNVLDVLAGKPPVTPVTKV